MRWREHAGHVTITAPAPVSLPTSDAATRHRIVVGMDDDPVSVAALRFAATEAGYRGADVVALHVWQWPSTWGVAVVWPETASPGEYILTQLQQTVVEILAERAAAGEPDVAIRAEAVQGVTVAALHDASRGADLLVLGARHHSRFLGSVSSACANHPQCPVVIVPADQPKV